MVVVVDERVALSVGLASVEELLLADLLSRMRTHTLARRLGGFVLSRGQT